MTRTVFNESNTGHITKTYPMFFGDSLGLVDTVNVVNKEIEMLKEKQRGGRWYPTEISLSQDKQKKEPLFSDPFSLVAETGFEPMTSRL